LSDMNPQIPGDHSDNVVPVLLPADSASAPASQAAAPADGASAIWQEPTPKPVRRAHPYPRRTFTLWLADLIWNIGEAVYWSCVWVFGFVSLMVGLAVLAVVPVVQFLTLGYLLEAGGRVARTGKLRYGLPGVWKAAHLGGIALGIYLWLLPLRLLADLSLSAQVIDPGGPTAVGWRVALIIATLLVCFHLVAAIVRGGKMRYFFWPFNVIWLMGACSQGSLYRDVRDGLYAFVTGLRLPYYFWLGLRGFLGAFAWLAVPVTLLAIGRHAGLVGFVGGALLAIVLLYLPFLQIRFAAVNRLRAMFEVSAVREDFQRAPWCFLIALTVTLAFAVPLYLLKFEMIPREAAWLPSLVFVAFIYPARVLTGWAVGMAQKRRFRAHWFFRWTGFLPMPALTGIYVFLLFFTQYAAWEGVWSLYHQHAFLLPVPFMGM
jgi:hypothetical protein